MVRRSPNYAGILTIVRIPGISRTTHELMTCLSPIVAGILTSFGFPPTVSFAGRLTDVRRPGISRTTHELMTCLSPIDHSRDLSHCLVDTRFHMLSFAGIAMERPLDVYLGWRDVEDEVYLVDTGLDISQDWIETDPFSIGSISEDWGDYDVVEIWLEFRSVRTDETSVRLGWIRLTQ